MAKFVKGINNVLLESYIIDDDGRKAYYHHTALSRGYVSVKAKISDTIKPYKGRFGEGFVIYLHNKMSTAYCLKVYYTYVNWREGFKV